MALDTVLGALMQRLLDCLCTQLVQTIEGPVCQCCLHSGLLVPMDACCDCGNGQGQAAIRPVSVYPSTRFPIQDTGFDRCPAQTYAAVLDMSVYRCASTQDDAGNPPSCADQTADTLGLIDDMVAMRRAVVCCLGSNPDDDFVLGAWSPVPVTGGCQGGTMLVTVRIDDCCPAA